MRWWIASFVVSYSVASLRNKFGFALTATNIFSHIANWSADAPLGGYGYALVPYERASNFISNSSSIPFLIFFIILISGPGACMSSQNTLTRGNY